jgi:hypothetical protein
MDWFEQLLGFPEVSYQDTKQNLEVDGATLRSRVNHRSFGIGELETPALGELQRRGRDPAHHLPGRLRVSSVVADVASLHRAPENRHALFQVASQFNLLEMTSPGMTPEDGVTRYAHDRTQGPACALAAAPATIYRNYFAPVAGLSGQTRDRQIDCLNDLGTTLGNVDGSLWQMRNGYALCTEDGLTRIGARLAAATAEELDALRARLRVGVHWNVQVTGTSDTDQRVSQVFCSALPVAYTRIPAPQWEWFARLVLEAAYEATLWSGVLNSGRCGSPVIFLTSLGGGAFGNDGSWIVDAIGRSLRLMTGVALDVRLVSHSQPSPAIEQLVREFG